MKIFLTGGNGMLGRNIRAFAKKNKYKQEITIDAPGRNIVNLHDKNKLTTYLADTKPDFIIHCAGLVGGIQANIDSPYDFCFENLQMGANVIQSAYEAGISKLINIGSSCMYPRHAKNPLSEDLMLTGGLEPTNEGYAIAKIATAKLAQYISNQNNLQYKTIIPCNLYGYWDNFDPIKSHMIPAAIRKVHYAKQNNLNTVEIWGDGNARREFLFSEDLADFIFFILNNYEHTPQLINCGLGNDYTINEYYETIKQVIGYNGDFVHDLSKPAGMKQKKVDIKKQTKLGWQPNTTLETGIKLTYDFFLNQ